MPNQLRQYQEDGARKVAEKLKAGKRKVIYQLPTGGGKTVTFATITHRYITKQQAANAPVRPVLILVHRDKLLKQTRKTLHNWYEINGQPIISKARHIIPAKVYVGMIETCNRRIDKIIAQINPGLIIMDEAHRGEFKKMIAHFKTQYVIGFTATPLSRSKKDPLKNYYDDIVCGIDIPDLIAEGSLMQCHTYAIKNDTDRKAFGMVGDDFNTGVMATAFSNKKQVRNTVIAYEKYGKGKKTMVFNCNINHSMLVTQAFINAGYNARHIDGEMEDEEKDAIYEWFEKTEGAILCNIDIATTGYDEPTVECIIVNRSTMSLPLWLQMTGRGSRPCPEIGKEYFVICDLGGNALIHGDWCDARDWEDMFWNPPKPGKEGVAPVKECPQCEALIAARALTCPYCGFQFPAGEMKLVDTIAQFVLITKNIDINNLVNWADQNGKSKWFVLFQTFDDIVRTVKAESPEANDLLIKMIEDECHKSFNKWCDTYKVKRNATVRDICTANIQKSLHKFYGEYLAVAK